MDATDIEHAIDYWHEEYNGPLNFLEYLGLSWGEYMDYTLLRKVPDHWNGNNTGV